MIENSHIEELMIRYFMEEISLEELRELEAWVIASPENKAQFFQLKEISDTGHHIIWSEGEKESSWQRMYGRIQATAGKEPPLQTDTFVKRKITPLLKYVAVALVTLSIGGGAGIFITNQNREAAVADLTYHEIRVEKGGRGNTLILSDGSKVTLNAMTTFRYPAGFSDTDRTVYLDGEAYFEIAKDETKPFIVKLKKQDITVLGTTFNVEAYSDENQSIVTLVNGSIALESYDVTGELMGKMFLKPNQRAVSDNETGSILIENIETLLAEAWTNGKYKFKDEPLSVIAKRLEKFYNVQIHIKDESLKSMKFTGTFSLDQDIQEVLHVIDNEKQYHVRRAEKEIYIVKK